jgi:hypothetical protein
MGVTRDLSFERIVLVLLRLTGDAKGPARDNLGSGEVFRRVGTAEHDLRSWARSPKIEVK